MLTKKNTLIFSALFALVDIGLIIIDSKCDYGQQSFCSTYWIQIRYLGETLLIFVPIFIFSSINYFMSENIFRAWLKLLIIWLPMTLLLVIVTPEYNQSILPIVKSTVAIFSSVIFSFFSLGIIIWKYFSKQSKRST